MAPLAAQTIPAQSNPKSARKMLPNAPERYQKSPMDFFFEAFVLDTIGELPKEKSDAIQKLNLQKALGTKSSEWKAAVKEKLALSDTIEIAILDLWYRNQEVAAKQGIPYPPQDFAMNFLGEYFKDGSKVDVWPPGALDAARKRIELHRKQQAQRRG